jgi:hypothetical protein
MPMDLGSLDLKVDQVNAETEISGKKKSSTDIYLKSYNLESRGKSTTNICLSNNFFEQIVQRNMTRRLADFGDTGFW